MTRPLLPPELEREIENLKIRVTDLENRLRAALEDRPPETIYTLAGSIFQTSSTRWYPRRDEKVIELLVSLVTAGTTDTVVRILKNDAVARTITVPTGQGASAPVVVNAKLELRRNEDDLRVQVLTAGTGAAGLTVQARMK